MKRSIKLAAAGAALALLATACGGTESADPATTPSSAESSSDSMSSTDAAAGDPSASDAAVLRANLTGLLHDHVWLAGNALQTAVRAGGDLENAQVKGAVKALDENTVELGKTIGSVYPDAEEPFLASWRQHIGFFVDYTLGKATMDDAKIAKAKKDLDGYRTSFGQLINSVVPELPADAVADELTPHVASLLTAIDAAVANDPTFQQKLDEAAHHMTMTAGVLTSGIVANKKITD
jgi:hypothetical protein